jgi:hypothetical protein
MSRTPLTSFSAVAMILALPLLAARSTVDPGPTAYGAPWMSVEMPANPLDPATREAAFVIRTYRHSRPEATPLTGTAEGVVDGERRSVSLTFRPTGQPGVFAVDQSWAETGAWVLAISTSERVHMLIEMGDGGGVTRTSYYGKSAADLALRSVRIVTGQLPEEQIDQSLMALAMGR